MFGTAMSYILGTKHSNLFLRMSIRIAFPRISHQVHVLFSADILCVILLTTAVKYLGEKIHCEGRDCKTKDITDLPLKIKY